MRLAYKQLTKQMLSNKIFITLLLILIMLTSLSFFFVKCSIDRNMEALNELPYLTKNQELYREALNSNIKLANMFFISLTSLTSFVFFMFFYRFFRAYRKQIGCLRSLGYKDSLLRQFFMLFTTAISLIGALVGMSGGYFLSSILIQANTRTYDVTGLIKGMNIFSFFTGVIVTTIVFCLVTFCSYFLIKGKEVGDLLVGKQPTKKLSYRLKVAHYIVDRVPIRRQFPLRIALRKPIAVFMIFVAVMTFNICMVLGYSLNISSKTVFKSQTMGHNYNYDSHFLEYRTEPVASDAIVYLDFAATLYVGEQEVMQDIVGFYKSNALYKLQNDKGKQLGAVESGNIYINPGLVEMYGVAIGDVLSVDFSGSRHQFTVMEIAENAKVATLYINAEELAEILSIPSGAYNAILSMEAVKDSDEMITMHESIENLNRNAVSYKTSGIINQVIGCLVGAILIFLALLINFQDNTRDILILNIMGYKIKEIRRLLIDIYLPIIIVFFILSIWPSIFTAKAIQNALSIATHDYMPFGTNSIVILIIFAILNIIYWIVKSASLLGVKRVIIKEEISEYISE